MPNSERHRVERGQTIHKIKCQHPNVEWTTIEEAIAGSGTQSVNSLYAGMELDFSLRSTTTDPAETEKEWVYEGDAPRLYLKIRVLREDGSPLANAVYVLTIPPEKPRTGLTEPNGLIRLQAPIPDLAEQATLEVYIPPKEGETQTTTHVWTLWIGALHPARDVKGSVYVPGVQQRLNNLGFEAGEIDGNLGPQTLAAIRQFRTVFGLNPPGKPDSDKADEAFLKRLTEIHDEAKGPDPSDPK